MTEDRTIIPGEREGFLSGCPFCASHRIGIPEVGTRFLIISGLHTGATATVVEWQKNMPRIENEFMAQLDHESPEWQTRVSTKRQMIQLFPLAPVPEWAPPLCMEDAGELHEIIIRFRERSFLKGRWKVDWGSFNEIIRSAWYNSLPLEPDELWLVLKAHGVPLKSKKDLIGFYQKGRNLLIHVAGKRPIKKKRVEPLSKGK